MFYGNFDGSRDEEFLKVALKRFEAIFGSVRYGDNNIVIGKTCSFLDDELLQSVLSRQANNHQERSLVFRLNTLIWAFDHALRLEGDVVECGVWRGFLFGFLTDYFSFETKAKRIWLYDTFAGIPKEYDTEGHDHAALREDNIYEKVLLRFARFSNVNVVRGILPASLHIGSPSKISLLHMDLNSSRAEIETLEQLFDRVVPGGMIIFDDYGWLAYRAQHDAEKAWAARRGYRILELPTGQGLLIKR